MPSVDGMGAMRRIVAEPDLDTTTVIVITTFEIVDVFDALCIGASGFRIKDTKPAELLRASSGDGPSLTGGAL